MIWKVHLNQGSWIGPAKVVIQEGATTVFAITLVHWFVQLLNMYVL